MVKQARTYLPSTNYALMAIGAQIGAARRELRWTASDLAGRLGVTPALVARIEKGAPGTAVGTVFEAAVVCGVPLFQAEPLELQRVAEHERMRVALLPRRVRHRPPEISDDF
ncbi:helix-turn-helix domain-containing protein [Cellulomonas sp. Y8]|uniref:helix-turn-helix domain-containing protein n=1 Tax=Cellulomonas sp. Y8 TaxID=2591145 RepID=UPI0011CBB3AA|nr:helix-turn-helix transcriptional regulator [Cellulomonas sp. Y8]